MRWTKDEYSAYLMKRQNKYKNTRVEFDGVSFPSKLERDVYVYLMATARQKGVEKIERQVPFILQEGFTKNGKRYRPIKYIADFVVTYKDGRQEVVEAKGKRTQVFNIKEKLFEKRYPELHLTILTRGDL